MALLLRDGVLEFHVPPLALSGVRVVALFVGFVFMTAAPTVMSDTAIAKAKMTVPNDLSEEWDEGEYGGGLETMFKKTTSPAGCEG